MIDAVKTLNKNLHIVIGPSSSGKSTFISNYCKNSNILMAYEIENYQIGFQLGSTIIHYNSLRAYKNSSRCSANVLAAEPVMKKILRSNFRLRATIICASRNTLIKRAASRSSVEPFLRSSKVIYPSKKIIELLSAIDMEKHYKKIISIFNKSLVEFELVDSQKDFRKIVNNDEMAKAMHAD